MNFNFLKESFKLIKKRSPVLAGILSVLAPSLGHMYSGELKKGISILGLAYLSILVAGLLGLLSTFFGFAIAFTLFICVYFFSIFDSIKIAVRKKDCLLKSYNRWYWYLLAFFAILIFHSVFFSFRGSVLGYEMFRLPAKSMEPTLQVGDLITIDTRYSNLKVGDVIVYRSSENGNSSYVRRIAALGKDQIEIKNGIVILNGKEANLLLVPQNRRQHELSISMAERKIPEGEVFLLGDWRDQSRDSRFSGTVPVSDVIGKVTFIGFSRDTGRIGLTIH